MATPVDAIGPNRHGYFYVQAVVADVADGASYDFGFDFGFVYDHPSGADIVVGIGKGEPFTGAEELSRGTITIHSATCSPKTAIDLEVKGTLANEYETEGSVEIDGRMDAGVQLAAGVGPRRLWAKVVGKAYELTGPIRLAGAMVQNPEDINWGLSELAIVSAYARQSGVGLGEGDREIRVEASRAQFITSPGNARV